MRKLFLAFFCVLMLSIGVSAAGDQIDTLSEEAVVNGNGEVSMTVTAEVSFAGGSTEFVFPLHSEAEDVTVSGGSYELKRVENVQCAVFTDAAGFSGKRTFVCTYQLPCSVIRTGIGQQFELALIEKGWAFPIAAYKLRMEFPAALSAQPAWDSAYYGNVIDNYLNIQLVENTVVVQSAAALKDHELLRITLQFPENTFSLHLSSGTTVTVFRWSFYVLLLLTLLYWVIFLRGKPLLPKEQQSVGMEATAGELDCQLYGKSPDLAATLAHWGNLGYLSLRRSKSGHIILQKQMEMGNERKPAERRLFAAIFRYADTCDVTTEHFRSAAAAASAPMRRSWLRRIFTKRSGSPLLLRRAALLASLCVSLMLFDLWLPSVTLRWVLIVLLALGAGYLCLLLQRGLQALLRSNWLTISAGTLALVLLFILAACAGCVGTMFLNLLLQVFCVLATYFGGKRTAEGEELVRSQLGLRRHLRRADEQTLARALESDGQYFYRTLPFAELLGVGAAFSKHFGDTVLEPCPWLTDAKQSPKTARDFYGLYITVAAAIRADGTDRLYRLLNPPKKAKPAAAAGGKGGR